METGVIHGDCDRIAIGYLVLLTGGVDALCWNVHALRNSVDRASGFGSIQTRFAPCILSFRSTGHLSRHGYRDCDREFRCELVRWWRWRQLGRRLACRLDDDLHGNGEIKFYVCLEVTETALKVASTMDWDDCQASQIVSQRPRVARRILVGFDEHATSMWLALRFRLGGGCSA